SRSRTPPERAVHERGSRAGVVRAGGAPRTGRIGGHLAGPPLRTGPAGRIGGHLAGSPLRPARMPGHRGPGNSSGTGGVPGPPGVPRGRCGPARGESANVANVMLRELLLLSGRGGGR